MKSTFWNDWNAPLVCAAICMLTIVGILTQLAMVANVKHTGPGFASVVFSGLVPLILSLPMMFWVVAKSQKQTRVLVEALESRIEQLESRNTSKDQSSSATPST